MYSSSNNFDPFQYVQNSTPISSSFINAQNPSSVQDAHSSSFFHFPLTFLDRHDLVQTDFLTQNQLQQEQQQILLSNASLAAQSTREMNPAASKMATRSNNKKQRSNINGTKQSISRRRTGKKDRHSKIHTAQGPRDRRMRLSLQIARKFFNLQDMLGFDKASKTIDWLFTKSKAAIKELADSLPRVKRTGISGGDHTVSSTSESEVMPPGITMTPNNGDNSEMVAEGESFVSTLRQRRSKKSNKTILNSLARESRDKARERARERTKEKQKIQGLAKCKHYSQVNPNKLEQLGSSSSLENVENWGFGSQEMKSPSEVVLEEEEEEEEEEEPATHLPQHEMSSVDIVDKFWGLTSEPKSCSIFDLSRNFVVPSDSGADFEDQLSGFPGNWDISKGRVPQNVYCAMPNLKLSTGNVHVQNPHAIFMTTLNARKQKTSSNFITNSNFQEQNLSSVLMPSLNTHEEKPCPSFINEQYPSPSLMTTIDTAGLHSHFLEDQLSCNPNAANELRSLY